MLSVSLFILLVNAQDRPPLQDIGLYPNEYYDYPPRPSMRFYQTFGKRRRFAFYGSALADPCSSPMEEVEGITEQPPVTRGKLVSLIWGHLDLTGGFAQIAIAPFEQSNNHTAFSNNIIYHSCSESNCKVPSVNNTDNFGNRATNCSVQVSIPKWLKNGIYTIQVTRYGMIRGKETEFEVKLDRVDMRACIDFTIIGSDEPIQKPIDFAPIFKGGDPHSANRSTCIYWKRKRSPGPAPRKCVYPIGTQCDGDIAFGSPRGNWIPAIENTITTEEIGAVKSSSITLQCFCSILFILVFFNL